LVFERMISFLVWPFVLQCASFSFLFCVFLIVSLLMGALIKLNLVFLSLEAIIFHGALLSEVIVLDLEARVFPFDVCFHFGEVVVVDLEANLFFTVCFCFIVLRCSPHGEVIVLDLEALVFPFDGCSRFGEVVVVDLEAFIFYSALLLVKSLLWTSRHEFLFFTLWWVLSFK